MGCVGFVRWPEANVSAASRKLKSLVMKGSGIGILERKHRRIPAASTPTAMTERARRLANTPSRLSSRENTWDLRGPRHSAKANATRTKPNSKRNREMPLGGALPGKVIVDRVVMKGMRE